MKLSQDEKLEFLERYLGWLREESYPWESGMDKAIELVEELEGKLKYRLDNIEPSNIHITLEVGKKIIFNHPTGNLYESLTTPKGMKWTLIYDKDGEVNLHDEKLKSNVCIPGVKCICGDCCKKPNVYLSEGEKIWLRHFLKSSRVTAVSVEINDIIERLS